MKLECKVNVGASGTVGKVIWQYIESMNTLHDEECLVLENKLSKRHVEYCNHKMKVHIATLTIRSSADYLHKDVAMVQ